MNYYQLINLQYVSVTIIIELMVKVVMNYTKRRRLAAVNFAILRGRELSWFILLFWVRGVFESEVEITQIV